MACNYPKDASAEELAAHVELKALKKAQKGLVKELDRLNEQIKARKKLIAALDPKWNSRVQIAAEKVFLQQLQDRRVVLEHQVGVNAKRGKELGQIIRSEMDKREAVYRRNREIRAYNEAWTRRMHRAQNRHEKKAALELVEAHNKALLGGVDS